MAISNASGEIRLPAMFGNHMVLQQQSEVNFWGWAAPEDRIIVLCSWLPGQEFTPKADRASLRWSVSLTTPKADITPHTITIKGGWVDITLSDILFGEVWLCSGQSNMEWQPAWGNVDVTEAQYQAANDAGLRFFSVPRTSMPAPENDCRAEWKISTRETMSGFSAAAYFFGRELRDRLGVPVGLVNVSWGGTPIEGWMHEASLEKPEFRSAIHERNPIWKYGRPGSLYNGMIAPLISMKIKGFIWYQGETNTYNADYYAAMLAQLAADWRGDFGGDQLPFYYAQIAPWRYDIPREGAALRDEQRRALARLPNSGMVVTSDIGNIEDIHPSNKTDVGKRFAAWALAKTYGIPGIACSGPLFREARPENGRIRVFFDHAENGILAKDGDLRCFEIAGPDRIFFPAKAVFDEGTVLVSAPEVALPVAVRFGFDNTAEPNLFNLEGLPASCFRSDDWPAVFPKPLFNLKQILDNGDAVVEIDCPDPSCHFRYTLDGSEPPAVPGDWSQTLPPLRIARGSTLKTRMFNRHDAPADQTDVFQLRAHLASGLPVVSTQQPSAKYPGSSGAQTLTDGLLGTTNLYDPAWAGYEGTSPEWTIDLGRATDIKHVSVGFLLATTAWIFLPDMLSISVSDDGTKFTALDRVMEPMPSRHLSATIKRFEFDLKEKARFVRISTKTSGVCPDWHQGKGQPSWLFVDELTVE